MLCYGRRPPSKVPSPYIEDLTVELANVNALYADDGEDWIHQCHTQSNSNPSPILLSMSQTRQSWTLIWLVHSLRAGSSSLSKEHQSDLWTSIPRLVEQHLLTVMRCGENAAYLCASAVWSTRLLNSYCAVLLRDSLSVMFY